LLIKEIFVQNSGINTVNLTARCARDQLNVTHVSLLPWSEGPLHAPPNHGNGADCGAAHPTRYSCLSFENNGEFELQ